MLTFRDYMEGGLWAGQDIVWPWHKPSDGIGGENPNPSRPDRGPGGAGALPGGMGAPPGGMGAPLGMMRKKMRKKMRK